MLNPESEAVSGLSERRAYALAHLANARGREVMDGRALALTTGVGERERSSKSCWWCWSVGVGQEAMRSSRDRARGRSRRAVRSIAAAFQKGLMATEKAKRAGRASR